MNDHSQSFMPEMAQETVEAPQTEFKSPSLIDMVSGFKANLEDENVDLKALLRTIEVTYLEAALKTSKGVVSHAAQKLNMRRTTFIEKMKKHQIVRQEAE